MANSFSMSEKARSTRRLSLLLLVLVVVCIGLPFVVEDFLQYDRSQQRHALSSPPGSHYHDEATTRTRSNKEQKPVVVKEYVRLTQHNLPPDWLWTPQKSACSLGANATAAVTVDPFPPNFQPKLYKQQGGGGDWEHYQTIGRGEGRLASRGQQMREIINTEILPKLPGLKLELGPFLNPLLQDIAPGDHHHDTVKYFDVLDLDGLKQRATAIGYKSVREVTIDYVNPTGDLTSIPDLESFSLIASVHVVEHQLDLVRHLNAVSNLLMPGGYYVLMIPDKRYCFDHHIPVTTIADVLEDYYLDRYHDGSHKLKSVLEHRALTGETNTIKNWKGEHKPPFPKDLVQRLKKALTEYNDGQVNHEYVDVHNYQFTPQDFAHIVDTVHELELTPMRVHRAYETLKNKVEFVAVLKKCGGGATANVDRNKK